MTRLLCRRISERKRRRMHLTARITAVSQKILQRLIEPMLKPIEWELRRANLSKSDVEIANPLTACGRRYFSQNDEDGILLEILRRIEITEPSLFLEFGVGDGTECNTIILIANGWRGVWVGGEPVAIGHGRLLSLPRLIFQRDWITAANAAQLAKSGIDKFFAKISDIRVASVDLDGNDGAIVRALLDSGLKPDVFIVEYNSKFPPPIEFEMPYAERGIWAGDDFMGASLQRWQTIFAAHNYTLVACNENGINAFFVRDDHLDRFTDVPKGAAENFRSYPWTRHRTSPKTVLHLASHA
jgi:hypothetical protein